MSEITDEMVKLDDRAIEAAEFAAVQLHRFSKDFTEDHRIARKVVRAAVTAYLKVMVPDE